MAKVPQRTRRERVGDTAAASRREAAVRAVARNARGSALIAKGKFVTPEDKSLDRLDKI